MFYLNDFFSTHLFQIKTWTIKMFRFYLNSFFSIPLFLDDLNHVFVRHDVRQADSLRRKFGARSLKIKIKMKLN
jgi:hypothetical protein